jgi:hypothetical protein
MQSETSKIQNPKSKIIFAFGVLILLVYARALQVSFLSDDYVWLLFGRFSPLDWSIFAPDPARWFPFHRPLGMVAWKLLYGLSGLNVAGYHLFSLLLHWLNSLLVVAVVALWQQRLSLLAVGAGLLFALFPAHVETVVWVSSLFDLLATFWYLVTLAGLALFWRRRALPYYLLSIAAFQLCLWSKESALTLPLTAMLLGLMMPGAEVRSQKPGARSFSPFQSNLQHPTSNIVLFVLPYLLLAGVNLLQRYLMWGSFGGYDTAPPDPPPLVERLASVPATLLAPFNQLLFPFWAVIAALVGGAALLIAGLAVGTQRRLMLFGVAWVGLTMLPVLSVLPVMPDLQQSRYLYLPAVGFCIVLAAALGGLAARIAPRRSVLVATGGVALLGAAYAAVLQVHFQPWLVAGQASEEIAAAIHRLAPHPRPGALLQVTGLPDNYQGAYIYRLGIDAALLMRYDTIFLNWPDPTPQPVPYTKFNLAGDFYQFEVEFDPPTSRWRLMPGRAVTVDEPQPFLPESHWLAKMGAFPALEPLRARLAPTAPASDVEWDFGDCRAAAAWGSEEAGMDCTPGTGLRVTPRGSDAQLISPPFNLVHTGWVEVAVTLAVPEQPVEGSRAQVYWRQERNERWNEQRSLSIDLPGDPRERTYHFFLRLSPDRGALTRLRVDPVDTLAAVQVRRVEVRVVR